MPSTSTTAAVIGLIVLLTAMGLLAVGYTYHSMVGPGASKKGEGKGEGGSESGKAISSRMTAAGRAAALSASSADTAKDYFSASEGGDDAEEISRMAAVAPQMSANEKTAMISRLSSAYTHGAVEIPDDALPRRGWISSKFTQMYLLLVVVSLLCLATFVTVLVVALNLRAMAEQTEQMTQSAQKSMQSFFNYPSAADVQRSYAPQSIDPPPPPPPPEIVQNLPPPASADQVAQSSPQPVVPRAVSSAVIVHEEAEEPVPVTTPHSTASTTTMVTTPPPLPPPPPPPPRLPPGIDPVWLRPENIPNLLQLAQTLHIDIARLPPEYRALLPTPINATVTRANDTGAPPAAPARDRPDPAETKEEVIPDLPASVVDRQTFHSHVASKPEHAKEARDTSEDDYDGGDRVPYETPPTKAKARRFATHGAWHDGECRRVGKCTRSDITRPPLLVISLDGFAQDYVDRRIAVTLERMAECGTTAEFVIPSYPSRTFPNHFTMVTGRWPESHGVVDNAVFDPHIADRLEDLKQTKHAEYFQAEPIWSTYKRLTGQKTACLYWVGCDHNITDFSPDYNIPYNRDATFEERANQILDWLSLPAGTRPGLITAYLNQPDAIAHRQKSDADVDAMLVKVDAFLDYLLNGLAERDLLECVNVLVVSDHGMHKVTENLFLSDHFSIPDGVVATQGVVARVYLNGSHMPIERIMSEFRCSGGSKYRIYSTASLPARYHHASTRRVGDVIFEGQPGVCFYPNHYWEVIGRADHGYDFIQPSMYAIFFARGPSIRPKTVVRPFQNVEYFHLFEELLGIADISDATTNGTRLVLDDVLAVPSSHVEPQSSLLGECPHLRGYAGVIPCRGCSEQEKALLDAELALLDFASGGRWVASQLGLEPPDVGGPRDYCIQPLGATVAVAARKYSRNGTRVVIESLSLAPTYLSAAPNPFARQAAFGGATSNCTWENGRYEEMCEHSRLPDDFVTHTLLADENSKFAGVDRARVPLHNSFVKNFFGPLQALTRVYLQRYGRLIAFTGTIFDFNTDGRADTEISTSIPSHVFRVLLSCREWRSDGSAACADAARDAAVIAFVLPHIEEDINCLETEQLLLAYTARVRDVELLTGVRFFADRRLTPAAVARALRTHIPQKLW